MIYIISVKKRLKFWKTTQSHYHIYRKSEALSTYIFLARYYHFFRARNTVFYFVDPIGGGFLCFFFSAFFFNDYAYWTSEMKALIVHS